MGIVFLLLFIAFFVVVVAGVWKVHSKAGYPGWSALVPIYNVYIQLKIADRPAWWLLLYIVPLVSLIPGFIVPIEISKKFGKGTGFGLGLVFLPFIFYPLLGFGDATYQENRGRAGI